MCQVLGVSRSGFYQWKKQTVTLQKYRKARLKTKIKRIHSESKGRYGSPKITHLLRQEGDVISERTVGKWMRELGIRSKVVKKYKATTQSRHNLPVHPNLVDQNFNVHAIGEVWVSDITYIPTEEGWLYLATVMDLYSRRVLGWSMESRMTKDLVIHALKRAFHSQIPKPGLIHHSDRGSQYASREYQLLLKSKGITPSMSRKGNCYDNACMESFYSIIKKELIQHERYETRGEAKASILEYIVSFYNYKRIHSYLNYLTPMEYEKRHG